ncbi:MAG: ABC transporter ATP-binding protein [Deinococcota bacterium]|nr:ABC transporter ATP-binding protein [Deinococcota bacterium]MDQ3459261.1 ABC transporter ATP-binding protein [Deinococcota bacterium]
MIVLTAVSKTYKDLEVLKPLTLDFAAGTFSAVVGPSGCGKSTLLRLVAGLESPSAGRITIDGRDLMNTPTKRILVFQEDALFPWLTLEKNVAFGLEMNKMDKAAAHEVAREWLGRVHLSGFGCYYPHQVSSGMRQRAALARSLALEPEVLLLDEPFGALDALTRLKLQDELLRLWQAYRATVVLVTHDVEEAVYLADRAIVLSPRPTRVEVDLPIALPRPRARDHPKLVRLKREILSAIGIEKEHGEVYHA